MTWLASGSLLRGTWWDMSLQVLPDLIKFMDSVHNKMMTVHKMTGQLEIEAGELVASKEFFIIKLASFYSIPSFDICFYPKVT